MVGKKLVLTLGIAVAALAVSMVGARPGAVGARSATADTVTARNKVIARRFFEEVLTKGDQAAAAELIAPDAVFHLTIGDFDAAGVGEVLIAFFTGFPDLSFTVEDMVAEDDRVAVRWTFRGTHTGVFQGVPPSGRPVQIAGISLLRIVDGRVVEDWAVDDLLGLMQQIGAIPAP